METKLYNAHDSRQSDDAGTAEGPRSSEGGPAIAAEPKNTRSKFRLTDLAALEKPKGKKRKSKGERAATGTQPPARRHRRSPLPDTPAGEESQQPAQPAAQPTAESSDPSPAPPSTSSAKEAGLRSVQTHKLSVNLLEHAKKVRATDLARRHSEVKVLSMSRITRLVEEAVAEAVQSREFEWNEKERQKLKEEAEEIFNARIQDFKAEKADLEAQTKHFNDQLERAQELLEEERQRVVSADQFTVSDAGLVELEKRMSRLLDHAVVKGGVDRDLETEMRTVVAKLLDDEREKIRQRADQAQSETIALLERKVGRLATSLEDTQQARERAEKRAHMLESSNGNVGLGNITDAGLDAGDPQREKKLCLLKKIVQGNKDVRKFMAGREEVPPDS